MNLNGKVVCLFCPQAGDKGDKVNPVVKLFVVGTKDTNSVHKTILPPDELADV